MLHTKFHGNRPAGFREEGFYKGCLPYAGMAAILVMGPASCHQFFHFLVPDSFHKNLV